MQSSKGMDALCFDIVLFIPTKNAILRIKWRILPATGDFVRLLGIFGEFFGLSFCLMKMDTLQISQ
jgi:hypothetical protein